MLRKLHKIIISLHYANVISFFMMSLHYLNESVLHYDIMMLGWYNCIPFHYANVVMLHYANVIMVQYVYVCRQTCLVFVCIMYLFDIHIHAGIHARICRYVHVYV